MHIRAGDWKLAGLEYVCAADAQPPAKILPCLEKYVAPVRPSHFHSHLTFQRYQVRPSRKKGPIQSKVGHSLGRRYLGSWVPNMGGGSIFYFWYQMNNSSSSVKVYNGYLNTMDQLGRLGDIPQPLQPAYKVDFLNLIHEYTFVILGVRGSKSCKASKSSRRNHEAEEVARLLQERPDRHRPLPRGDADQGGGRQVQVLHFPPRPSRQLPLKCLPGWGQAMISKIS